MNAATRDGGRPQRAASAGALASFARAAPALLALAALSACNTTQPMAMAPRVDRPARAAPAEPETPPAPTPAPTPAAVPTAPATPPRVDQDRGAAANLPPPHACECSQPPPKPHHKHKSRSRAKVEESEPQSVGPAPPSAATVVDAEVGRLEGPLTSILGKNVFSPKGEDLGRVVDLLADSQGRVRVAIIDFGGFLGVGTRRIAVDWPLLHFSPADKDKPLVLTVTREKLQSAPEYKDAADPRVLLVPAAAPDAAGAGPKK